jgi:ribose-1,5-bisphosphate isomerase, e2b2 family
MDINETANAIQDMSIRGAGRIARAGASALSDFAENYKGNDISMFVKDINKASKTILDSRPTAVSLWNGVQSVLKDVDTAESVKDAVKMIKDNASRFVKNSEKAVETIGRIGAKRIKDGDLVVTHCNSSAALSAIKEAHRQGKKIKVFATESRPWRQGILTVNELAKEGIDVTLMIDSAVRTVMKKADVVFVGADTITAHGALVNKIGTSQIALAANEARVPFIVCSETYKFSPMTLFGDMVTIEERDTLEVVKPGEIPAGVKIFNPVFDSTPAKYIDAIVTEVGMIHPAEVYGIMIRQFGERIFDME